MGRRSSNGLGNRAGEGDFSEAGCEGAVGEAASLCPGSLVRRIHGDQT